MSMHITGHFTSQPMAEFMTAAAALSFDELDRAAAQLISDNIEAVLRLNWKDVANSTFWRYCNVPANRRPTDGLPPVCVDHIRILKHRVSGEVIMVSEPYDLRPVHVIRLNEFCADLGLRMHITGGTVHYPNHTVGLVFTRRDSRCRGAYWWAHEGG